MWKTIKSYSIKFLQIGTEKTSSVDEVFSVWMGFGVRKLLGLFALTGYFCTAEALLPHSRMIKARFIR
jgi:hypothetical protein